MDGGLATCICAEPVQSHSMNSGSLAWTDLQARILCAIEQSLKIGSKRLGRAGRADLSVCQAALP